MGPLFLDIERVLHIHCSMIEHYGGEEGIRDAGLLHSAIAMPQAAFDGKYLHVDLFEMAAAYLCHIVQNHPFLDGNKRTGAAAALVFLTMNGIDARADEEGLADITLRVASGQADKKAVAIFFQSLAMKREEKSRHGVSDFQFPNELEIRNWALENLPKHIVLKRIELTYGTDWPSLIQESVEITIEYENRIEPRLPGSHEDIDAYHAWKDPLVAKIRSKLPPESVRIGFKERYPDSGSG